MATTTATVMFTDLVDSTALMSRVGETGAEGLRREHFTILRAAVDQRGERSKDQERESSDASRAAEA